MFNNFKNFTIMAEEKTYVFGNEGGNMMGYLAPLLQQRGIDPSVLALMNNRGGFGCDGGYFIWVIFLFFLMGWGGNGWGGNRGAGLAGEINNDYGREMLLQAINGNGNAISQLATTLNCDINAVQGAINAVQSQVQSVGSQVGMSSQQIINAIQSGDASIASQLANCCCNIREAITKQGYDNQLATLNQTNVLGSKIDYQTTLLNDKFCQLEMREMQNKIDALREERSNLMGQLSQEHQTLALQNYQAQALAPITATVTSIQREIDSIKCKLPESVSVPYSPVTAIPTCVAAQYGLYNYGFPGTVNNGYWA